MKIVDYTFYDRSTGHYTTVKGEYSDAGEDKAYSKAVKVLSKLPGYSGKISLWSIQDIFATY